MPTEAELSQTFQVSRITSKRALSELEQEGLIERIRGKGSFVKPAVEVPEEGETSVNDLYEVLLLLPFHSTVEFSQYAQGIISALADTPYQLNMQLASTMTNEAVAHYAGVIYYPENVQHSVDFLFYCQMHQKPVVLLDQALEMFPFSSVTADNQGGGYQLTHHLQTVGCQVIYFIGAESFGEVSSVRDRYLGYLKAMTQAGQAPRPFIREQGETKDAYLERVRSLATTASSERIGFVVANDLLAIQLIQHLQKQGVAIPDEVAVTGFDNIQAASLLTPTLTTVAQDFYQMGVEAGTQLLLHIQQPQAPVTKTIVPIELYQRESTMVKEEDEWMSIQY